MTHHHNEPDRAGLTRVLNDEDDSDASELHAVIYREMRMIAHRMLGANGGQLGAPRREQTRDNGNPHARQNEKHEGINLTLLVHEAWIKLQRTDRWQSRAHFFGSASNAMRQVLVDEARKRSTTKRRASHAPIDPDSISANANHLLSEALAVDEAISLLALEDERAARVAVMKLYGNIDTATIAAYLDVNERTVQRDWRFAQAWLADALRRD